MHAEIKEKVDNALFKLKEILNAEFPSDKELLYRKILGEIAKIGHDMPGYKSKYYKDVHKDIFDNILHFEYDEEISSIIYDLAYLASQQHPLYREIKDNESLLNEAFDELVTANSSELHHKLLGESGIESE